jgi:hypothetical protein
VPRTRRHWPWFASLLLAFAIGCVAVAPFFPIGALIASGVLVITSAALRRRLEGGRWPVLAFSVLATVISAALLLTSLDLGSTGTCPDGGCHEHPVPERSLPSR